MKLQDANLKFMKKLIHTSSFMHFALSYTKVCNRPPTTTHNQLKPSTTSHNHPQSATTIHNQPQPSATSHNHPKPATTIHNHPKTIHNHPKNHPQPPMTIHNHPKITQKSQLFYCTLDVNTETGVDFDNDMKQWYIYMCVSVCICFIRHCNYYFG